MSQLLLRFSKWSCHHQLPVRTKGSLCGRRHAVACWGLWSPDPDDMLPLRGPSHHRLLPLSTLASTGEGDSGSYETLMRLTVVEENEKPQMPSVRIGMQTNFT